VLRIRTGKPPLKCSSFEVGQILAELKLPSDWMESAIDGQVDMAGTWKDNRAQLTGFPGHFRIYDADGICHIQGTVGMSEHSDMQINEGMLSAGQSFEVQRFTIRDNNG